MPERFKVVCTMQGAIQVLSFTFTFTFTTLLLKVFTKKNFVANFTPLNLNFIHKNNLLGELGVTYAPHL